MKIADLVTLDDKAEFRSDVQLDAYDRPEQNLALLNSYLFSSAIPARSLSMTRDISAVGLLKELVDIYLNERAINRLCLIANYGHGKSHLALALANYFGRAANSPELNALYPKIAAAIDDPAGATRYKEFKHNRHEFLLIRLRGDVPQSLHAQFLLGLSRGLAEHETTHGIKLPFWYQEAARLLAGLTPQEVAKANEWLAKRNRDLALLRLDIEARKDVFDETVGTLEAAKGMKPALSEVALAEALQWAADEVVATGKLGGILILFDEFSLYIERYGHRTAPAELQDLLNGVDNLRGKAAFLAFAQADPDTTADNLHSLNPGGRASLKKVLTRLEIVSCNSPPCWKASSTPTSPSVTPPGTSSWGCRQSRAGSSTPATLPSTVSAGATATRCVGRPRPSRRQSPRAASRYTRSRPIYCAT